MLLVVSQEEITECHVVWFHTVSAWFNVYGTALLGLEYLRITSSFPLQHDMLKEIYSLNTVNLLNANNS